jgi:O-methyltransferase domain/Dimerisation domain
MATTSTQITPDRVLQQMITGFRVTQLLHVAAKLGIADELAHGPKSTREIAKARNCDSDALYRVLRALANVGVLVEQNQQRFKLTPMGEYLREGVRGSLRSTAMLFGEPWVWNGYGQLLHSVQTGEPAFQHAHQALLTDYLRDHADAAQLLDDAEKSNAEQELAAILRACDFTDIGTVVDLGGGKGSLLAALLAKYPSLKGTLFDLPQVVAHADSALTAGELAGRCTVTGGDFFENVPQGADVYLLKHVVRDFDDLRAAQILKNCRAAMSPDSRVVLFERLVAEPNESSETKLLDIDWLALTGGRLRSEFEHQALLDTAGLRLTHFRTTRGPLSILEAMPL